MLKSDTGVFEENGETYVQSFLLGMHAPHALDPITHQPRPFAFKDRESMLRVARTAIGMPYLENPGSKFHVAAATAEELYAKQKDFGWGEIIGIYENPNTGNVNAIWKPFPEYVKDAREGKISPFSSPYIVNLNGTLDAITDGQIAHLHGVPSSGFEPEVASIKSVCIGGLQQCMTELKAVAAAGHLKQTFSSTTLPSKKGNMVEQAPSVPNGQPPIPTPNGQEELTLESVNEKVVALEKEFGGFKQTLDQISSKIDGLSGTQSPAQPPVAAAAADISNPTQTGLQTQVVKNTDEEVETLKKDFKELQDERKIEKESLQKEKDQLTSDKRKQVVREIIEAKLKLHRLKLDEKDTEFKRLMELKDEGSDDLRDLSVLHEEITSEANAITDVAAAGRSQFDNYFGLTEITADDHKIDFHGIEQRIGS